MTGYNDFLLVGAGQSLNIGGSIVFDDNPGK